MHPLLCKSFAYSKERWLSPTPKNHRDHPLARIMLTQHFTSSDGAFFRSENEMLAHIESQVFVHHSRSSSPLLLKGCSRAFKKISYVTKKSSSALPLGNWRPPRLRLQCATEIPLRPLYPFKLMWLKFLNSPAAQTRLLVWSDIMLPPLRSEVFAKNISGTACEAPCLDDPSNEIEGNDTERRES